MRGKRGLIVLAAALMVQAFVLYRAFHYGPMAGLIPWDDCLTLQRGLHNLRVLAQAATPWRFVTALPELVIHSPVSDLQAMAGLMLGSGALWVSFALNIGVVLLALYTVLFRTARSGAALFLALLAAMLVQPITLDALTFLKADWKGGLLIAAALFTLYEAVERGDARLKLFGAGLLGLGVAAKLTAFYMPLFALAVLLGFEALAFLDRPPSQGRRAFVAHERPIFSYSLALALGPFLAFFLLGALGHHRLVAYIAFAVSNTWSDGRSILQRAVYYSPFTPGGGHWGHLHWLAVVFIGGALVLAARARDRVYPAALAVLAILAAMLLAPLVLAHTSNWEFGASFLGVVFGAVLISIRVFARLAPRHGGCIALALVILTSVTAPLEPPFIDTDVGKPSLAELHRQKAVYQDIAADLMKQAPKPAPKVRLLYEDSFAPFPDLSILYFQRGGELIDIDRIDDLTRAKAQTEMETSDFLLTAVPAAGTRMRGLLTRFPTSADPGAADKAVAARPDFVPVRSYALADGAIRLYQRRPTASAR